MMSPAADRETVGKAWWLLGLALLPFLPIAAAVAFHHWLETHINIHNDAIPILIIFFGWAGLTLALAIGVPWLCWRLITGFAATPAERRRWRIVVVAGNLPGCIVLLAAIIVNGEGRRPKSIS